MKEFSQAARKLFNQRYPRTLPVGDSLKLVADAMALGAQVACNVIFAEGFAEGNFYTIKWVEKFAAEAERLLEGKES